MFGEAAQRSLVRQLRATAKRLRGNEPPESWGGHIDFIVQRIRELVPQRSFADIGCMWAANGRYCFLAEESGAAQVTGADVLPATSEFEAEISRRNSAVRFLQGDMHDPALLAQIGVHNVVLNAGVLYHVPNPVDTALCLRKICNHTLILGTAVIPEQDFAQAAVLYPFLEEAERQRWNAGPAPKLAIDTPYKVEEGFGNWIWGLAPSAVAAILRLAGFEVVEQRVFASVAMFICRAAEVQFRPVGSAYTGIGPSHVARHWTEVPPPIA